ncbi:HlyD family efflux transporter periplasmic adaptor subunit [Mastigocoleus testarum]|uniref:HlyD family efflux transporter periplasmic adaptor subunit n=1 Tax=Mastigocoleus testarum TaxID=996925 RepID=UPI00040DF0A6|nr:HlyD family efflux transporter periplasmic adaptor subunit [Mastigocoleus testarum]
MFQPQNGVRQKASIIFWRYIIRYTFIFVFLSLSTACASLQAQNNKPETSTQTEIPTSSRVVALGRIIPEGDVIKISVVNARDSRVNQILVKEGDFVKPNQLIAVLQGTERAEQQLREAKANVAIKRARLLKIRQGDAKVGELAAQRAAIAELEARLRSETRQKAALVAQAEATLRNTKIKYERNHVLTKEGALQQAELDNATEEYKRAQASISQSKADLENTTSTLEAKLTKEKANLRRLKEVRPVDVEIAKAELEQALIQVEQRKAELDDTQARAPIGGQILRINTRVGEQVNTEQGIAELGQTKQMYVVAEVYETDIIRVRKGQTATINSEYGGFKGEIKGKVDQIGLQIGKTRLNQDKTNPNTDVNARVVEVKIRVNPEDNPKVSALTGMQVRVKIDV